MIRARYAVIAALVFNPALGSLYAWSVFLKPLEADLGVVRAELSIVFSTAVVSFALAMTCAPAAYRLGSPPVLVLLSGLMCALGLGVAALAPNVALMALGYGLLYGAGSGFGYSVTLQAINLALPHRRGLANGVGIGLFAAGSALCAPLFMALIGLWGAQSTLALAAALFLVVTAAAAFALHRSGIDLSASASLVSPPDERRRKSLFPLIWLGFFLGASAGLMVISQAAGIVLAYGGSAALAATGTTFVAIGNGIGRLAGGWGCDHLPLRRVVMGAHGVAAVGLGLLLVWPTAMVATFGIALVGLSYGLMSGAYPAALGFYYGVRSFGRMMGRLVTAWGMAGLLAPLLAGHIYDRSGGYGTAVSLALAGVLAGVLISNRLPPKAGEVA